MPIINIKTRLGEPGCCCRPRSLVSKYVTKGGTAIFDFDLTEKVYSFEADYPSDTYDIEVTIDGDNCTEEQIDAWTEATLLSSLTNKIIAMGDVPSIDIPILLTVIPK